MSTYIGLPLMLGSIFGIFGVGLGILITLFVLGLDQLSKLDM